MQYRRPYYYKYYPSGGVGTVMMITRAGERVTNYSYIIETLWYLQPVFSSSLEADISCQKD